MIDQLLNTCTDIVSCFQTIYNLLFALLFFLSFLWFLYGAIEYLLSAGSITSKEEGKKRMINSIVAVLIAFLIPVILNMINPKIFNFQLKIPVVKVKQMEVDLNAVETSESNKSYYEPDYSKLGYSPGPEKQEPGSAWDKNVVFKDTKLKRISWSNNDTGRTEYINPALKDKIIKLDKALQDTPYRIIITDCYSPYIGEHKSKCHLEYGTCCDIVVDGLHPDYWGPVIEILNKLNFYVYDERYEGSKLSTGPHLHVVFVK
jgi:hypothetical protein